MARRGATASRMPLSNPGVRIPPPLLFVVGLVAGWLLDRYVVALPIPRVGFAPLLGAALIAIGIVLVASGMITFRRARTAIMPHHSANRLVVSGPYRFTRNPMYTGLTIVYVGVAILLGTVFPFILLPIVLLSVVLLVIKREERYLADAFGSEYAEYCARVRRWL